MNREQAKALLPIIAAYAEGKTILLDGMPICINPHFDDAPGAYTIKPEPKVVYVNEYDDISNSVWNSREEAKSSAGRNVIRSGVKYIEAEDQS